VVVPGTKMVSHDALRHRLSQLTSSFQRMIEMEARIHARPENFVYQVSRVFKHMLMRGAGERHAIGDDMYLGGPEEIRDQRGSRTRQAAVRRRILGMVGVVPSGSQAGSPVRSVFPPPA